MGKAYLTRGEDRDFVVCHADSDEKRKESVSWPT